MTEDNLTFYTSKDIIQRSCAINSMAHEMAHLISYKDQGDFESVLLDSEQGAQCKKPATPDAKSVASYLVGTVAQCVWLKKNGRLDADPSARRTTPATVEDCVTVFGVLNFNRARCWEFKDEHPIKERPGIPCPVCAPWSCASTQSGVLSPPHQPPCEAGTTMPTSKFTFDGPNGKCRLK